MQLLDSPRYRAAKRVSPASPAVPACDKEIVAIDTFLGTILPMLSVEFFEDIRNFNLTFSRADLGDAIEGDDE